MKHRLFALRCTPAWLPALVAAFAAALPAQAANIDVGVSIDISQPGVHGRIDIGRFPQPAVVVAQPVIISRPVPRAEPVYLWVPPGHRKDWKHHCAAYRACGVPVYFVQDRWYDDHVMRGEGRGRGKSKGHGHGHDDDRGGQGDRKGRDDDRREGGGRGRD